MVVLKRVSSPEVGKRIDLVVETVMLFCEGRHVFRIMGSTHLIVLEGILPFEAVQIWTVLQGCITSIDPLTINIDNGGSLIPHRPLLLHDALRCVELCSGAGFMTTGVVPVGLEPILGVEQNESFRHLFGENHPEGTKFLVGDIGDPAIIKQALESDCQGAVVFAGVSCQPYSQGGDKLSAQDPRSQSLPDALQFAWLIQAPAIVLECAPGALHDAYVQETIRVFAFEAGFVVRQRVLHLDRAWGAKRERWWAILTANPLGPVDFDDLPLQPMFQSVASILPVLHELPQQEFDELLLTLYELGKFQSYSRGLRTLFLDYSKHLPTALHAWGNQVYPCACGCRPGFSEARMQCRGLFAVLIPTGQLVVHQGRQLPQCRHMHPSETALLCGANPDLNWGGKCRLGLAAVGQMASPIQALWVAAHLRRAIDRFVQQPTTIDPAQLIREWCSKLLDVRDRLWPFHSKEVIEVPPVVSATVIEFQLKSESTGKVSTLRATDGMKILDLLRAETQLINFGDQLAAFDVAGEPLSPDLWISPGLFVELRALHQPPVCNDEEGTSQSCDLKTLALLDEALGRDLDLPLDLPPGLEAASRLEAPVDFIQDDAVIRERQHSLCVGAANSPKEASPSLSNDFSILGQHDVLCQLQQPGLLRMLYPQVDSQQAVEGLLNQTLDRDTRKQILANQGMLWADDEVRFHLQPIVIRAPEEQHVEFWDPISLTSSFRRGGCKWIQEIPNGSDSRTVITGACIHGHWIPIAWRVAKSNVYGFTYNISEEHVALVELLQSHLCVELNCQDQGVTVRPVQVSHHTGCGAVAVDFLHHLVFRSELCASVDRLYQLHSHLRSVFVEALEVHTPRPWIWGQGQEVRSQLLALLRQHGVSAEDVDSRVEMLYSKLGKNEVSRAIQSSQPWKELKWAANQLTPPIQIIRPQELQQAISQRASNSAPVGRKKDKAKAKEKVSWTQIPSQCISTPKGFVLLMEFLN